MWEKYGIYSLESVYEGTAMKNFADIFKQHNIPSSAFFQYLQIRHIFNSISWPPVGNLNFWKLIYKAKGYEKGISLIYYLHILENNDTKWSYMVKWESEMQTSFSLLDWREASQSASKLSH